MGTTFYFAWEIQLIEWLQARMGAAGTALASVFTMFGEELACIVVLGFLYWCWDKEFGRYVGRNILTAVVFIPMIKNVALRRRPYFDTPAIQCLKPVESGADIYDISAQGYSFPSGHSANAAALYGSLGQYSKKQWLKVLGIVLPLLTGISRFCLGVHYPTDVLAGWAIGALVLWLVPVLEQKIHHSLVFGAVLLLAALPGWFYCRSDDFYTAFGLLAGFLIASEFEERYVRFLPTRRVSSCILRIVGGAICFFVPSVMMKMFLGGLFAEPGLSSYVFRSLRYGVSIFLAVGVYPLMFRLSLFV